MAAMFVNGSGRNGQSSQRIFQRCFLPSFGSFGQAVSGKSFRNRLQLTLVISNSMGPWKKFESSVVRLKRSYEDTGSVVCLTTKGRQLERNFEELKPASRVPILGTILNIFDVFVTVFFSPLNSLNLMKRLITSRYLFLCE